MEWFFFSSLIVLIGITILYSYLYGITPTPTSRKVKAQFIQMLPPLENAHIVELGSGWGTLAFALARHFPHCQVIGYEISPFPYFISKLLSYYFRLPNLSLKRKDFFHISLENASLVTCYLYPGAMQRLKTKFKQELPSQAYVGSHTFAIPGWIPIRFEQVNDLYRTPIYLYQMNRLYDNMSTS